MTTARSGATSFLLQDGDVLVFGGDDVNGVSLSSAELYDPKSGTFSETGSMLQGRGSFGAAELNDGRVLVAGGCCTGSSLYASAELYDPKSGAFQTAGSMLTARMEPALATLADGRVLIAGGNGSAVAEVPLASAEIFDPETLAFTSTGSMAATRDGMTATPLLDGRVLVAGGATDRSAELYDPRAGAFGPTGQMIVYRTGLATATLLADGRVYIAGGGSGDDANSAEIYQP
ncbi:MAG: kelch repeat-containing protein [Verrucomicrobiota bacterium]|jgi:hypothetical protein